MTIAVQKTLVPTAAAAVPLPAPARPAVIPASWSAVAPMHAVSASSGTFPALRSWKLNATLEVGSFITTRARPGLGTKSAGLYSPLLKSPNLKGPSATISPSTYVLQSLFHVECLSTACSVTVRNTADVTVCNGNGQPLRARNAGRPWLVPGFCEKTRQGHDRSGQHRRCRGVRRESGCPGQGPAGPGDAAAAHHRGGAGLRAGAVAGDAGELLGTGPERRA